jgi:hypothetical protein
MKNTLFFLIVSIGVVSCSNFKTKKPIEKKVLARVYNTYLYKDKLKEILPEKYNKKDSVLLVSNYIETWARQQLLLENARINLNDEANEIQNLVEKYRQDLLINKYSEAIITQQLDTVIAKNKIDDFYKNNKEIFRLNEDLIKFRYVQFSKDFVSTDEIIAQFKSDKEEDVEKLLEMEFAFKSFHLNDSVWVKYNEVLRNIPILKKDDIYKIFKKNKFVKKQDANNIYLIRINKIFYKKNIAPREYVESTIKQMILHSRRLELLKSIEKTLLNDAFKNGKYEIYK